MFLFNCQVGRRATSSCQCHGAGTVALAVTKGGVVAYVGLVPVIKIPESLYIDIP